jgi:cell filamentation protein
LIAGNDEQAKWWFCILDMVGVLNEEPDYTKTRNYWKYIKANLKKAPQLVSATIQLKLSASES